MPIGFFVARLIQKRGITSGLRAQIGMVLWAMDRGGGGDLHHCPHYPCCDHVIM